MMNKCVLTMPQNLQVHLFPLGAKICLDLALKFLTDRFSSPRIPVIYLMIFQKTEFWKQTIKGQKFDAHWQVADDTSSESGIDCMIVDYTPAPQEGTSQEDTEIIDPEDKFNPTVLPLFSEV